MSDFLTAPGIMTGLGLFFGIILAVAYRLLRVDEDPRLAETEELLPGTNCGACGEPGCLPFAIKLVNQEVQPSGCTVASPEVIDALADFLGVDTGDQEQRVARLHCAGGRAEAFQIAEYNGFESCRAAAVVSGGGKGCAWGCLGLADCEVVCGFDAIVMTRNGLPQVDNAKCTACGDCVSACPKGLFEIVPMDHRLFVQCSAPLAGEAISLLCSRACDGCGKCAADGEAGTITMENELPQIDYGLGVALTAKATERCPTQAILWLEGNQFNDQQI